jgi:hypothetical protein
VRSDPDLVDYLLAIVFGAINYYTPAGNLNARILVHMKAIERGDSKIDPIAMG